MELKSVNNGLPLGKVVSIVGGGGKTTLLYWLGERLAAEGKKVLLTTTTHIYIPAACFAPTAEAARRLWKAGTYAVVGTKNAASGKLSAPEDALLEALMAEADAVLIEADGAKGRPIKAPRAWEPVIHPRTDMVLAVMGLSAIGQPLEDCCFGLPEAMAILQAEPRHILTEFDAAALLASNAGGRKGVGDSAFAVVLNQCDNDARRRSAEKIGAELEKMGICNVYTGFFRKKEGFSGELE